MSLVRLVAILVLAAIAAALSGVGASALEATTVPLDGRTLDLTNKVQLFHQPDDRIQVQTAPGADGIVRRIEVRSQEVGRQLQLGGLRARQ